MEKEKLQRCGDCGAWQQDPSHYSEQEQKDAELLHCGCKVDEPRYISRDMAIDGGDISMEGQRY